ncbi:hypothetical protein SBA4_1920006 [Candidatus Sulfopaludibacter sp. SbA4]|nr:hypothetical protein SBA4_1920006 [Candidatus Sulfopaludibacter sp. SbA4]
MDLTTAPPLLSRKSPLTQVPNGAGVRNLPEPSYWGARVWLSQAQVLDVPLQDGILDHRCMEVKIFLT